MHVDAYLKNEAGWATKLTPVGPGTATVNAGQNDFHIHELSSTEYFIIENRQQAGRDVSLPDAGLAIWHVDEAGSNNNEQMTAAQHYECSIEQADGLFDLEHNANAGDAQDLFGGTRCVAVRGRHDPRQQLVERRRVRAGDRRDLGVRRDDDVHDRGRRARRRQLRLRGWRLAGGPSPAVPG